jgi:hypothetical protein
MRILGQYILRGKLQAIVITSLLTLLALVLPLFSYVLSGIAPGLVTLRHGALTGIQVITGSLVVIAAFALAVRLNPQIAMAFALGVWLPLWLCAAVLRMTESQGHLLLVAGLFGAVFIAIMHLVVDDLAGWWAGWLKAWIGQALPSGQGDRYLEQVAAAASFMNALVAAGLTVSLTITLMAARWWQAYLFNPGGFRREFHALRLPRGLLLGVLLSIGLVVAGKGSPGSPAMDIFILMIFLYFFQGLAAAHRLTEARKLSQTWLVVMYVLLLIFPQIILFLACFGMADSWRLKTAVTSLNDNP